MAGYCSPSSQYTILISKKNSYRCRVPTVHFIILVFSFYITVCSQQKSRFDQTIQMNPTFQAIFLRIWLQLLDSHLESNMAAGDTPHCSNRETTQSFLPLFYLLFYFVITMAAAAFYLPMSPFPIFVFGRCQKSDVGINCSIIYELIC